MEVGHTHIDQDQRFSVCGSALAREARLGTPVEFLTCIRNRVEPARGRLQVLDTLHVSRIGTSFFAPLNLNYHGHTGKDSVHVFRFVGAEDVKPIVQDEADFLDTGDFPGGTAIHGCDVIMLAKDRMGDEVLSQSPVLVGPVVEAGVFCYMLYGVPFAYVAICYIHVYMPSVI